ncbi:unnamed protein product [Rotaria sordida]|uniref:Microbial-type PARG catalytic domain-containing protein n=1 Tax=Rotaria sordida TaxID=392033 RepID=A0A819TZS3_9BILA|nr:unnamed protein product [Rotaria sordida]CAF4087305.1 unnamed protein product [Rotaria sordida]
MYPMDEYGAIYTSGLTVFRQPENTGYEYMNKPLYGVCSLAMAAYRDPMLNGTMLAPKYAVGMRKKIENIFAIAYHHKHDCLVLSALGCGAFRNPPSYAAKLFHTVIEQYAGFFQSIIFAIIDDHNTGQQHNPQGNFKSFKEELDGLVVLPVTCFNQPNTMYGPYRVSPNGSIVKSICIRDLPPCRSGATCPDMYDINHAGQFSHPPLCIQSLMQQCTRKDDNVHMSSFIHRKPCKDGAQCKKIKGKHDEEFEHPPSCPESGNCQDTTVDHAKAYRHPKMCPNSRKCRQFQRHVKEHCDAYRHCIPICLHGGYCVNFHERKHIDEYQHPFPKPCSFTPYQCTLYEKFITAKNPSELTDDVHRCHNTNTTGIDSQPSRYPQE